MPNGTASSKPPCPACGRTGPFTRKTKEGHCPPCYKRLIWRPRGGPAVEHERTMQREKQRRRNPRRPRPGAAAVSLAQLEFKTTAASSTRQERAIIDDRNPRVERRKAA